MDIHSIRQELKRKNIYDIPIKVTFYARVSTESDEQLNSLGNQIGYYKDYIVKNKNWIYVDGYIDEGLSGMSTKKRDNFHRMIADAKAGLFDLIITKEISRFARNTLDSIQYTRELLSDGVGVFFQNDNINTVDEDSELRLTIMSGIAQDELRKLSSRIKFGHQQAIKNNVVIGNSRIFGYVKKDKHLEIDEAEAVMVKSLFELYATGDYSMKNIEDLFWEQGYKNHNGNKIAHTTMAGIISNPKYKGYYVGNKVKIIDMFTKKQKFLPPEEWVMFKDETGNLVPAIVDEDLWDKANQVLLVRSRDVKARQNLCNHKNLFTGKIICKQCGLSYYRRDSKDKKGNVNSNWICSGKIKNGKESCNSFIIYESDILPILRDVFSETRSDISKLIGEYVVLYRQLNESDINVKTINNLKKQIDINLKKKNKLLGYNAEGKLSDSDFLGMNKQCTEAIKSAEEEIAELENKQQSDADFKQHIEDIQNVLKEISNTTDCGIIDQNFVDKYIDKIFVTPEGDSMKLEIKIFTGEIVNKNITNLRLRSGHIFLTMCPERKTKIVRNDRTEDGHTKEYTYSTTIVV